ncbi:hypothetical protein BESB_083490 [Besnoitia besnoiti]|uniref:Transmembrane protein n=1 Tax=Besnoitia besnoiti TaxID=94643 RepID=A0A2A9MCM7_BESBE|nr:hypothetical protein BESB_083490 [Besnoitia besnoiti]PFH33150.1 hypothetical protein BESB_083490 [Besnoitia besnoiti]
MDVSSALPFESHTGLTATPPSGPADDARLLEGLGAGAVSAIGAGPQIGMDASGYHFTISVAGAPTLAASPLPSVQESRRRRRQLETKLARKRTKNRFRSPPALLAVLSFALAACIVSISTVFLLCVLRASRPFHPAPDFSGGTQSLSAARLSLFSLVSPHPLRKAGPGPRRLGDSSPENSGLGAAVSDDEFCESAMGGSGVQSYAASRPNSGQEGAKQDASAATRKRPRGRAVPDVGEEEEEDAYAESSVPDARKYQSPRSAKKAKRMDNAADEGRMTPRGGEARGEANPQLVSETALFVDSELTDLTEEQLVALTVQPEDIPPPPFQGAWYGHTFVTFRSLQSLLYDVKMTAIRENRTTRTLKDALAALSRCVFLSRQFSRIQEHHLGANESAEKNAALWAHGALEKGVRETAVLLFGTRLHPVMSELEAELLRVAVSAFREARGKPSLGTRSVSLTPLGKKVPFFGELEQRRSALASALRGRNILSDLSQWLDRRPDVAAKIPDSSLLRVATAAERAAIVHGPAHPLAQIPSDLGVPHLLKVPFQNLVPGAEMYNEDIPFSEGSPADWAAVMSRLARLKAGKARGLRTRLESRLSKATVNRTLQTLSHMTLLLAQTAALVDTRPTVARDSIFTRNVHSMRTEMYAIGRFFGFTSEEAAMTLLEFLLGVALAETRTARQEAANQHGVPLQERVSHVSASAWYALRRVDFVKLVSSKLRTDSTFAQQLHVSDTTDSFHELMERYENDVFVCGLAHLWYVLPDPRGHASRKSAVVSAASGIRMAEPSESESEDGEEEDGTVEKSQYEHGGESRMDAAGGSDTTESEEEDSLGYGFDSQQSGPRAGIVGDPSLQHEQFSLFSPSPSLVGSESLTSILSALESVSGAEEDVDTEVADLPMPAAPNGRPVDNLGEPPEHNTESSSSIPFYFSAAEMSQLETILYRAGFDRSGLADGVEKDPPLQEVRLLPSLPGSSDVDWESSVSAVSAADPAGDAEKGLHTEAADVSTPPAPHGVVADHAEAPPHQSMDDNTDMPLYFPDTLMEGLELALFGEAGDVAWLGDEADLSEPHITLRSSNVVDGMGGVDYAAGGHCLGVECLGWRQAFKCCVATYDVIYCRGGADIFSL